MDVHMDEHKYEHMDVHMDEHMIEHMDEHLGGVNFKVQTNLLIAILDEVVDGPALRLVRQQVGGGPVGKPFHRGHQKLVFLLTATTTTTAKRMSNFLFNGSKAGFEWLGLAYESPLTLALALAFEQTHRFLKL